MEQFFGEFTGLRERVEELESQEQPLRRTADGSAVDGALGVGGTLLSLDGKSALQSSGGWLRLNNNSEYANGVYTPGVLRANTRGEFGTSGRVRLGDSHPTYPGFGALWRNGGSDEDYTLLFNATNTYVNSRSGNIYFRDNNADRAILSSTGLIVTAGVTAASATISGNSAVGRTPTASTRLVVQGAGIISGAWAFVATNSLGSNLMYLENSGLSWVNQAWTVGSDERLKDDIADVEGALGLVLEVRPRSYYLKADVEERRTRHLGVVAQELQQVLPELVSSGPDGLLAVRYEEMTPLLVGAVKELAAQVAALEARAEAQDARLAALEAKLAQ